MPSQCYAKLTDYFYLTKKNIKITIMSFYYHKTRNCQAQLLTISHTFVSSLKKVFSGHFSSVIRSNFVEIKRHLK